MLQCATSGNLISSHTDDFNSGIGKAFMTTPMIVKMIIDDCEKDKKKIVSEDLMGANKIKPKIHTQEYANKRAIEICNDATHNKVV